ncbi:MAG: hypothetical protein CVV48_08800 [Spirochaetae bacterium HGW-Spirochaetae-4]|nr:MAG: hypothetical protein A2Y31_07490 [Spirochaetes bacterium GWC2_52_13]PKL10641.1 MAG: hypothetical protein CVV52_17375 [Spirochaetae bacterium HGW-Spirochaetae-8]PKL21224.1 MAG: hypothetical protein CVV48_08800 [Spirochaetae bacterium HGW-Spirochaetae-4]HCG63625.1 hypothetical protein [Sphaerochaeta sp.]
MIQVLDRAVSILDFIAQANVPVRLPEIAQGTGIGESTCANIISSLVENGLLEKEGARRKYSYSIGQKIQELSKRKVTVELVRRIAAIAMDSFASEVGVSCILAVLEHQYRVIIHESKPQTRLQVVHHQRYPAYASSLGRFILAHYENETLNQFIEQFGLPDKGVWRGVEDLETMQMEFDTIRNYVMKPKIVEEDHVVMMFAPIMDQNKFIAALGMYLPISNFNETSFKLIKTKFSNMLDFIQKKMHQYE